MDLNNEQKIKLKEFVEEMDRITEMRNDLNKRIDEYGATFEGVPEIGDIITCTGHAHNGKNMIVDKVITSISNSAWLHKPRFKVQIFGRVIKNDNTPGEKKCDIEKEYS